MCDQSHAIYRCPTCISLEICERKLQVSKLGICEICLSQHSEGKCKFDGCKKCGEKHNTLPHEQNEPKIDTEMSVSTHATRSADK